MNKKIYFFLSLLCIIACFVFYLISENLCIEKRYSFDFGSAAIKAKGARVDKCKSIILEDLGKISENTKIINCINHAEIANTISQKCINDTVRAIKNIEQHFGIHCDVDKCAGIATAWARKAVNGKEVLDNIRALNIKADLVTQEIEGAIGFYTAIADSETKHVQKENVIVWDIGGGSFQLSTLNDEGEVHVYNGPWGIETFEQYLRQKLGVYQLDEMPYFDNKDFDIAILHAIELLGKPILQDPVISKKLQDPKTVVFGIGLPMRLGLHLQMKLTSEPQITDVFAMANRFKGMTFEDVTSKLFKDIPQYAAPIAQITPIVVYGIMNGAGISRISIIDSPLNDYVLVEPKFWN